MELLEIIIWPLIVLIIAILSIFVFRKPIISLLNRTKSVQGGKFGLNTTDSEPKKLQQKESKELHFQKLEKELNLFNDETRERFQEAIKNESEWDKAQDYKSKFEVLLRYSEALYIVLFFERIYNSIFGSQITILKHLNSSTGVPVAELKKLYNNTIQKNKENLKDYPFDSYWGYLENQGLVVVEEGKNAKITWIGRDFLKYLIDNGLAETKLN